MLRQIILIAHIFLASMWIGGILFVGWGVFPATTTFSFETQRQFLLALMKWVHHLFSLIGSSVIITGILLGTTFGPIRSWQVLWDTTYGNTWLAALIIGILTLLWGIFIGYREMMLIFNDNYLWQEAEDQHTGPLYRELFRLAILESVEAIGFVTLIILMVSLRS